MTLIASSSYATKLLPYAFQGVGQGIAGRKSPLPQKLQVFSACAGSRAMVQLC